jgi:hypothetical protein
MHGNASSDQTVLKMDTTKDKRTIDYIVRDFGRSVVTLRDLFDADASLDEMELLFIENHFHALQMAHLRWKRKHRQSPGRPSVDAAA